MEDYSELLSKINMACCVISVERKGEGYGDIRIAAYNELYKETMQVDDIAGCLYYEIVPKDLKFEDFCFRAAVKKEKMHAYVETRALGGWTDQTLIPLGDDDECGYCLFLFRFTKEAEPELRSDVTFNNANFVIKIMMKLRAAANFYEGLDDVTYELMKESSAFSCVVLMTDEKAGELRLLGTSCEDENVTQKTIKESLHYETVVTWESVIGVSNAVIVNDRQSMDDLAKRSPIWGEELKNVGVKSLCMLPLNWNKKIVGYLYVTDYDIERTVEIKELLELASFFLASEISSHDLMLELERIGIIDSLTDCYNRNALINRIKEDQSGDVGVLYADINGLKDVNDTLGHDAGDKLIQNGADILLDIFEKDKVYRSGGDEFVVISTSDKAAFDEKVSRFKELTSGINVGVRFASGSYYGDSAMSIDDVMKEADAAMYRDKANFYRISGIENIRRSIIS